MIDLYPSFSCRGNNSSAVYVSIMMTSMLFSMMLSAMDHLWKSSGIAENGSALEYSFLIQSRINNKEFGERNVFLQDVTALVLHYGLR